MSCLRQRLKWHFNPWVIRGFLVASILLLIVAACISTKRVEFDDVELAIILDDSVFPPGDYYDVAWLNDSLIAFMYLGPKEYDPDRLPQLWDLQLVLFNVSTQQLSLGPAPQIDGCFSAGIRRPERLPNSQLAFLYRCNSDDPTKNGVTLYMWDVRHDELHPLQFYRAPFAAGRYSFSPDMESMIQEHAVGAGLNNELYKVATDGEMEQLLPDWQRASQPSWSPNGESIAFIGSPKYLPGEPQTFPEIEALARHPWGLYLMDANGSNIQTVVADLSVGRLQWLPQGDDLVFSGEYDNTYGIWVLNALTRQITRIWHTWVLFDISPDGTKAVILRKMIFDGTDIYRPIIVDMSTELHDTPTP